MKIISANWCVNHLVQARNVVETAVAVHVVTVLQMKPVPAKACASLPVCRSVKLSLAPRNAATMVAVVVVAIVLKVQPVMD